MRGKFNLLTAMAINALKELDKMTEKSRWDYFEWKGELLEMEAHSASQKTSIRSNQ